MTWFVNYTLDSSVAASDRGLAYGDGVFETIHAMPSALIQLDDHLARLYRGLHALGMPFGLPQEQQLESFLSSTILPSLKHESVVKIIVTRGEGGRGYLPPENPIHSICIGVLPCPDYLSQQKYGVSLSVSPVPVSTNRFLAGIKHLNKLENVLAKRLLRTADFEAIMLNEKGDVIECIQSNIFWVTNGQLYTPSLELSGVAGTYRQRIMESSNCIVNVGNFSLEAVLGADEVFITNSLMKIVPVKKIEEKEFDLGSITRQLQSLMLTKEKHAIS